MENLIPLRTFYDTPERKDIDEVQKESDDFNDNELLSQVLEGFPEMVYILNENRQIVAWNSRSTDLANTADKPNILGKRFGEMINCIHSNDEEAGCGTSIFCSECGSAKAIKYTTEKRAEAFEECRITATVNGRETAYDFLVHTTPIAINNHKFTIYALKNIENDKRRYSLEKIFFHDVLNTSGALNGLANMLKEIEDKDELEEVHDAIIDSSNQLLHEILSQRELRNAEEGNLTTTPDNISVNQILRNSYNLYAKHELANGKNFSVIYLEKDFEICTDKFILVRSIGNLIKNALEASGKNNEIKLYTEQNEKEIIFHVFNNKVIPENVQLQIFRRSFSTKDSANRGIGTYSVKLLIEQYLKGKVEFISDNENMTIFSILIPYKV